MPAPLGTPLGERIYRLSGKISMLRGGTYQLEGIYIS